MVGGFGGDQGDNWRVTSSGEILPQLCGTEIRAGQAGEAAQFTEKEVAKDSEGGLEGFRGISSMGISSMGISFMGIQALQS